MKMVKSLLLGSAAGLMAVAGAQAADLPVKAAPVEYVKICSLYGAGFYYIPGTDICVKFGGYVRGQYYINTGNSGTNGYFYTGSGNNQQTRQVNNTNDFILRARTIITMDARSQTEWGTVRTYMNIGWTQDSPASGTSTLGFAGAGSSPGVYANRAFIQWAGFTFGKAQSFWDIFPQAARTYHGLPTHDTGDSGINLAAYTTQWGNGISSTIAIEDPRRFAITNVDAGVGNVFAVGNQLNNDLGNVKYPDIVSNIRIDQAWGSFQVMSAMHDVSAAYDFSSTVTGLAGGCTSLAATQAITGAFNCGHPDDKIGWAAGVGGIFNLPFIAAGDTFAFQVNYAQGATRYVSNVQNGGGANPASFGGSYSLGLGFASDAIVRDNIFGVQNGSLELTTAWGAVAAFEHFWTPALRTSAYGGFIQFDYNSDATAYICNNLNLGAVAPGTATGGTIRPVNINGAFNQGTCTPDFGLWYVGSRTQWNIRPDFYMGVDVLYQKLDTAFAGLAAYTALAGTPRPSTGPVGPFYTVEDQDALSVTFRVHRDIVP